MIARSLMKALLLSSRPEKSREADFAEPGPGQTFADAALGPGSSPARGRAIMRRTATQEVLAWRITPRVKCAASDALRFPFLMRGTRAERLRLFDMDGASFGDEP